MKLTHWGQEVVVKCDEWLQQPCRHVECVTKMCSAVGNTENGTYLIPPKLKHQSIQIDGRVMPMVHSQGRPVMTVGAGNSQAGGVNG